MKITEKSAYESTMVSILCRFLWIWEIGCEMEIGCGGVKISFLARR
jgi:hypothetical protein